MNTYSFRAEAAVDIGSFVTEAILAEISMTLTIDGWCAEIATEASIEQVRAAMGKVDDGHVMLETLRKCPMSENSFERDFGDGIDELLVRRSLKERFGDLIREKQFAKCVGLGWPTEWEEALATGRFANLQFIRIEKRKGRFVPTSRNSPNNPAAPQPPRAHRRPHFAGVVVSANTRGNAFTFRPG